MPLPSPSISKFACPRIARPFSPNFSSRLHSPTLIGPGKEKSSAVKSLER